MLPRRRGYSVPKLTECDRADTEYKVEDVVQGDPIGVQDDIPPLSGSLISKQKERNLQSGNFELAHSRRRSENPYQAQETRRCQTKPQLCASLSVNSSHQTNLRPVTRPCQSIDYSEPMTAAAATSFHRTREMGLIAPQLFLNVKARRSSPKSVGGQSVRALRLDHL